MTCARSSPPAISRRSSSRELVARYGPEQTRQFLSEIIDYSERLTRAALRDLPDGEWSFEDWIDDDGVDVGKPIRLFVTIRKTG